MRVLIPPVQAALWFAAQQVAARVGGGFAAGRPTGRPTTGRRGARRPTTGRRGGGGAARLAAGGVLVAGAGVFGLAALREFIRRGTTWHPGAEDEASVLVVDGPNAFSRNPMYTAMAIGLVGTGLAGPRPWTALAGLGLLGSLRRQVGREERALAGIFGEDYDRYRRRVRRWL